MKRLIYVLTACLLASSVGAQSIPYTMRDVTLASNFDLDGEAADADQVVTVIDINDATSYTIAAQPDACRLIDVTVVDANSSVVAGTLTVVGTDCWGYPMTATFDLTGGSGVKTGVVVATGAYPVKASGAYFASITSLDTGVVTGEVNGSDTLTVGVAAIAKAWPMYGRYTSTPSGRRWVDIFGQYDVAQLVTNGAATTDVAAVSASTTAPFESVAVGDLIIFNVNGEIFVRRVVTRASADAITINAGVTLPSAGVNFSYKKRFYFADPADAWIPVKGYDAVSFAVQVDANVATGGIVSSIECATVATDGLAVPDVIVEEDTATVNSGATGTDTTTIDLRLKPHYTHCRAGIKIGTADDGDTADEDIDIVVGFRH